LLADDHVLLLEAFEKLLEPSCEVVGKVSNGRDLLSVAPQLNPDVIVLDISMPQLNGLDAGRHLRRIMPEVKLVYLTVHEDPDLAAECMRMGASGYLVKCSAVSELFEAIQRAIAGKTYVTPISTGPRILPETPPGRRTGRASLTPRQQEVLQLLAEGYSMKEVANLLGVTPRTVAFHKYRIMEKQGIRKNAELIQFAIREGLVSV
jgi:DNA-binding NarL/FixJ family response regulator